MLQFHIHLSRFWSSDCSRESNLGFSTFPKDTLARRPKQPITNLLYFLTTAHSHTCYSHLVIRHVFFSSNFDHKWLYYHVGWMVMLSEWPIDCMQQTVASLFSPYVLRNYHCTRNSSSYPFQPVSLSHHFIGDVVDHCQTEQSCQRVQQLQPLLQAPGGAVIPSVRRLPPTQTIHHPVAQLNTRKYCEDPSLALGSATHETFY